MVCWLAWPHNGIALLQNTQFEFLGFSMFPAFLRVLLYQSFISVLSVHQSVSLSVSSQATEFFLFISNGLKKYTI